MLNRYQKINKNGEYIKRGSQNPKIGYAVMMSMRTWICSDVPRQLGKLLVIGIRYSVFRK